MRFQTVAAAALVGLASAAPAPAPVNNTVTLYPNTGFLGKTISWPVDGNCHALTDEAPKLDMVGSVRIFGDIMCHLHDSVDCDAEYIDVASPGVPDLVMILNWASRAKAMKCEKATLKPGNSS